MSGTLKSTKKEHIELSATLKDLRKDVPKFTQADLARALGVSRETVVAIENCHLHTMDSIEMQIIEKWWKVCKIRGITERTKDKFATLIRKIMQI